jgi:hypothetical protein
MARRKTRLITRREPNGRPQRDRTVAPSEAKRIRDTVARMARQPEYGTELGRLWLDDKISAPMYEAGKKWVIVAVQRSMALQGPSAHPRSLNIGSGGESHPVDPDSPAGQQEAKHHAKAVQVYDAALNAVPKESWTAIETVCGQGLSLCGHQQLLDLRCGLLILASHWHLTDSRKSVVR